jgi:hypothetical protein
LESFNRSRTSDQRAKERDYLESRDKGPRANESISPNGKNPFVGVFETS